MRKKRKNRTESPAETLAGTARKMAEEGYVALPARKVFGERVDKAGPQWKDVYNTLLGAGPDGGTAASSPTSPVGAEIPVTGGTEGLGYMSWGPGNNLPNNIALLVSMLPYTAVGVKFNADVIAGLGPKPKYRYSRYSNGTVQTDSIDYGAAGTFIEGQIFEKRKTLLELVENGSMLPAGGKDAARAITERLGTEIKSLEADLKTWEETLKEVKEFMKGSNLDLIFTELAGDISHMGICFPSLQLDRQAGNPNDTTWNPKVIALDRQPCTICRLERMDPKNRINYVYVSNRWYDSMVAETGKDHHIAAIPALDPHRPLKSLEEKVRDVRIRAYNGKTGRDGKSQSERPTHFILPCYYPSMGRPYYPEPAWFSILRGDVYKYTSTIIENRSIAKENSNSAGKIIYIHTEYLAQLYLQNNINKLEEKDALRDKMWNEINEFLKDRQNNGQTIISFTFIGSDGKEHDAWRIVDVPISSKTEADANKTELEELSNIIFLALGIHSVLIGNSIGASSSGGTQQREMYELKKLLSVPTQRLLLGPLNVVRDFNGWDPHLEWEIGQMTLTTLDRNKNGMEETKV